MARLSKYQKQFGEGIVALANGGTVGDGKRHIILDAKAGSGKTFTITHFMKYIPTTQRVVAVMFNKRNADDIQPKLPASGHCKAMTTHSLGNRVLVQNGGSRRLDDKKVFSILDGIQMSFAERQLRVPIKKMVSIAKAMGIVPDGVRGAVGLSPDTAETWSGIIDQYAIDFDEPWQEEAAISYTRQVLKLSIDLSAGRSGCIDFDDMLYMPVIMKMPFPKYDWVFVDEAQDLSPIQHEITKRSAGPFGHVIAVGDPNQCQPTGTMVDVVVRRGERWNDAIVEKRCIEDLKIDDVLVTMSQRDRQWCRGKKIQAITKRPFEGKLVVVKTAEGHATRYTPNHHCFVSFSALRGKYCVYLMRKGEHYRIGKAKMDYGSIGSGVVCRMLQEKADAAWILAVYDTEVQALTEETVLGANYQIPQLVFTNREVWAKIESNTWRGERLLHCFGRDARYPLFSGRVLDRDRAWRQSVKRPMITHAVNIMNGCLVLPYAHAALPISRRTEPRRIVRRSDWLPVTVTREQYSGSVYSMTVEGDHTYVGDGIVTHNCIYGFRGAATDSMARLKADLDAHEMPLSICYRCDKAIIREAKKIVPGIEWQEDRAEGVVDRGIGAEKWTAFTPECAVLCPFNAPLAATAFRFIRQKIACRVLGREIGQGLVKMLDRLQADTAKDAERKLDEYVNEELGRLEGKENKIQILLDKAETLRVFLEEAAPNETMDRIKASIEALFADDARGMLTLSTIHKSKGAEYPRVFLMKSDALMATTTGKGDKVRKLLPWEIEQKRNLLYVGITRAQNRLTYLEEDDLDRL